jgi:RNA polymerase sigma-70 factor (ECF subfamily)
MNFNPFLIRAAMTQAQFNNALLSVRDRLWHYALRLTSDREKAKDLLQETCLKALVNKDRFIPKTDFRAWTFTIMKNLFLNNRKRDIRTKKIFDRSDGDFHLLFSKNNLYPSPESFYRAKEILNCIYTLEDDPRTPFTVFLDGYTYKKLTDYFNLNLNTLKSRIFFSPKRLRKALKDYES